MMQDRDGTELNMLLRAADFKGKDVLEVGCGDGRVTRSLAPLAGKLVAIDPDDARLAKARAAHPGIDFRNGTGEQLEFPDSAFDLVAFTFSLHHQDPERALAEAARVLRPGGHIVAVEPSPEGDMHRLFRLFKQEDDMISAADSALGSSHLVLTSRETFDIEYLFDGMEDLYDFFFGGYGLPREEGRMAEMRAVVGGRAAEHPIRMFERVNLTALRKA